MQSLSRTARDTTTFPYQRLFEFLGTSFHDSNSDNIEAEECPICGKPGRFYINRTTGQYSCKHGSCNEEGNQYSVIRKKHAEILANTKDDDRRRLAKMRDLSLEAVSKLQGAIILASNLHTQVSERRLSHGRFIHTLAPATAIEQNGFTDGSPAISQ